LWLEVVPAEEAEPVARPLSELDRERGAEIAKCPAIGAPGEASLVAVVGGADVKRGGFDGRAVGDSTVGVEEETPCAVVAKMDAEQVIDPTKARKACSLAGMHA